MFDWWSCDVKSAWTNTYTFRLTYYNTCVWNVYTSSMYKYLLYETYKMSFKICWSRSRYLLIWTCVFLAGIRYCLSLFVIVPDENKITVNVTLRSWFWCHLCFIYYVRRYIFCYFIGKFVVTCLCLVQEALSDNVFLCSCLVWVHLVLTINFDQ